MKNEIEGKIINIHKLLSLEKNEEILEIVPQKHAYSNFVCLVLTNKRKLIYKEYNCESLMEERIDVFIQKKIGSPIIIKEEEKYRFEIFVEHEEVNWSMYQEIAKELKKLHDFEIKLECTHIDMLETMLIKNKDIRHLPLLDKIKKIIEEVIMKEERLFLCHNDLQLGNMIYTEDKIKFIDYEYSCMGSPWIDIANIFCESMTDYEKDCVLYEERGLTHEQKREFLLNYDSTLEIASSLEKIKESETFSHFYWFLWARYFHVNQKGPSSTFNYREYGISRAKFLFKNHIITNSEFYLLQSTFN